MKKLIQATVFTLSAVMIATPVIAAPQGHVHNNGHAEIYYSTPHDDMQHGQQHAQQRHQEIVKNRVLKPSRDWKAGQALPSRYYGKGYDIDHKRYKHLSKPGKHQRWIRVNGDFILINTINYTILKVIAG